eukprot:750654_1
MSLTKRFLFYNFLDPTFIALSECQLMEKTRHDIFLCLACSLVKIRSYTCRFLVIHQHPGGTIFNQANNHSYQSDIILRSSDSLLQPDSLRLLYWSDCLHL